MEVLKEQSSFIVKSKLNDLKDTGGIFDSNMRILAYFKHEHVWRTPRGPIRVAKQARATDIFLESFDGNLFGEINEIPPKLGSMRLIRKFEIYNDKKELVGVVREKPKASGSDWMLENVEEKVIAFMIGDRKRKDYEIQTPGGDVLARCLRDASLDEDSYRVDILAGGVASFKYDRLGVNVDLFLVLCYIVVLDLAKTGWTRRESDILFFTEIEKEHLAKMRFAEIQAAETKVSKSFPGFAYRHLALSLVQGGLAFALATIFLEKNPINSSLSLLLFGLQGFESVVLYAFGIAILVAAFIGVIRVKMGQFNKTVMVMGSFGVFSLYVSGVMLAGAFGSLMFESTILTIALFIVGFGILVNAWFVIGLFGDFGKKK